MGKICESEDAIDEGKAYGSQRDDAPENDAIDDELCHLYPPK
jgi:hypothetical protein